MEAFNSHRCACVDNVIKSLKSNNVCRSKPKNQNTNQVINLIDNQSNYLVIIKINCEETSVSRISSLSSRTHDRSILNSVYQYAKQLLSNVIESKCVLNHNTIIHYLPALK